MRYLFTFLLFVSLSFRLMYAQDLMNDEKIKQKIISNKILTLRVYKTDKIQFGITPEDIEFSYNFNSKGNITEKSSFYNGLLIQKDVYDFDSRGNLAGEVWYNPDNIITFFTYTLYEYDSKNNILTKNIYNSDSSLRESFSFTYNEKGRKSRADVKQYFEEGEEYYDIYDYDSTGKIFSVKEFSASNELLSEEYYVYDENGNIMENDISDEDGDKTISNEYDDKGNLVYITETTNDEEGTFSEYYELIYDEKGLLTEEIKYDNNKNPEQLIKYEFSN